MSLRLFAVILGHLTVAGISFGTWAMGLNFAPELIGAQVVIYPLIMGVVGFWVWYGFWSAKVLRQPGEGDQS